MEILIREVLTKMWIYLQSINYSYIFNNAYDIINTNYVYCYNYIIKKIIFLS